MIWVIRNYCIFKAVIDTITKQLENSKATWYVFTGNRNCNISVMSRTQIITKQHLECKGLGQDKQDQFLGPLDPWIVIHVTSPYRDMWNIKYTNL